MVGNRYVVVWPLHALAVTMVQEFLKDDTLHVMVDKLLNCQVEALSDKDTKLDVLAILANVVRIEKSLFVAKGKNTRRHR